MKVESRNKSELFRVSEEVFQKVAKSYNTSLESLMEDVEKLKIWLQNQPHLPEIMDDKSILNFLILNKASIEKTKSKIDMYYTIRSILPEMYEGTNPKSEQMKQTMDLLYYVSPPQLTEDLYRLTFFKVKDRTKCDQIDPKFIIAQGTVKREIRLHEDCLFGDMVVLDLGNLTFSLASRFAPLLSKVIFISEKVFSVPIKGIYFINGGNYVTLFTNVLRKVLKPKIFERVHVLDDADMLKDFFPKRLLPKDYGGEGNTLDELQDMLKLKLTEYEARFDKLDVMRVDESLRPEKLKNDDILGYYGNFKALIVD